MHSSSFGQHLLRTLITRLCSLTLRSLPRGGQDLEVEALARTQTHPCTVIGRPAQGRLFRLFQNRQLTRKERHGQARGGQEQERKGQARTTTAAQVPNTVL